MKINEASSELIDHSKRLDKRIKNEIVKKENEIENINQLYDKKIELSKAEGEDKYINSLIQNDNRLTTAAKDYENKLNSYRENLEKTQLGLSKQEMTLKNDHLQKVEDFKTQNANALYEKFINATENQKEIDGQMNNSILAIKDKSLTERQHIETSTRNDLNALAREYNSKEANEEREYRSRLKSNILANQEDLNLRQKELKDNSDKEIQKSKRTINEKSTIQKEELSFLDKHQKDVLTQKQTDFNVRYQNLIKEHNGLLAELKTHFESDVKKMVEQTSSQKRTIANKKEDSFYRVEILKPTISENEKEYMVSLTVPEHEKENVHLSVQGRGVKMTLTRKFTETLNEIDGSTNRSTKNELFSREFPCKDILNPKLVDQKYENGVLTFRIQKL